MQSNFKVWIESGAAIATVAIFILALWLNILRGLWRRPKLKIYSSIAEPYCSWGTILMERRSKQEEPEDFQKEGYSIRIKVKNGGKNTALNCRCRLENIYVKEQQYNELRRFPGFDPIGLHWFGHGYEDFGPTSLPRDASQFTEVFYSVKEEKVLYIKREHFLTKIIPDIVEKGEYYFRIIAYAENAEPCRETFWLKWNQQWDDICMRQLTRSEVKRLTFPPEEPLEELISKRIRRKELWGFLRRLWQNLKQFWGFLRRLW